MASGVAHGNRLLPILAFVVVLMALYVGFKAMRNQDGGLLRSLMDKVPTAPEPDADTPAETIRTLTAKVAAMTNEMKALREKNDALLDNKEKTRRQLRQELMAEWRAEQVRQKKNDRNNGLQSVMSRINELTERVSALDVKSKLPDMPIGLGLNAEDSKIHSEIVWIEPLDIQSDDKDSFGKPLLRPVALRSDSATRNVTTSSDSSYLDLETKQKPIPFYTVPANATLIGSTGWTALVGRIPVNGNVQDPYPFKIIVGVDNLAANGITVPNVEGMIFSGIAVGDWNLSCVSGNLTSVTFVFTDGTIRTIKDKDSESKRLGWISDDIGIPCVSGKLITNAAAYLTNRIAIGAFEAGARAAAASETTVSVSPTFGTGTSSVTGDVGKYVFGQTLAGGASEVREWLDARMGQSFDAVFVPAGVKVAVHIDEELRIDYDPVGRKVNHATNPNLSFTRPYLD